MTDIHETVRLTIYRQPKKVRRQRRREHLWREQNGLCLFCRTPMMHWKDFRTDPAKRLQYGINIDEQGNEHVKIFPKELATVFNLVSRNNANRLHHAPQEKRLVMACHACADQRSQDEVKGVPLEVRQAEAEHDEVFVITEKGAASL